MKAKEKCKLCKLERRLNPRRFGLCDGCWEVTAAEGTRSLYGAPAATTKRDLFLTRIRQFNKMRAKGYGIQQIADEWGCTKHAVRVAARRARQQGMHVEPKYVPPPVPKPPKEPAVGRGRPPVPHGGGATGRHGCGCQPCVDVKRAYMRNYNRRWMKEKRAAAKQVNSDATQS